MLGHSMGSFLVREYLCLYGKDLKVEFLAFRRPEKKFASVEELKECMRQDIQAGEAYRHEW